MTVGEIFERVSNFKDILNHNPPTMTDFETLYGGTEAVNRQQAVERDYCQQVLNVAPESKQCTKAMKRLGWESGVSLYLLIIKNILTDGKYSGIEIYIAPRPKAALRLTAGIPSISRLLQTTSCTN